MGLAKSFVNFVCRFSLETLCRIDKRDIEKVPANGPLILYANHTGSVEAPIIYSLLQPRPAVGIAKAESWDNWFLRWIFTLWDVIPIRRGETDMDAMRKSLGALERNNILGISPEGTRNKTGALLRAKPGIVILAMRSEAPLQPIAHWGGENFIKNLKRLKRTDFYIRVGPIFRLDAHGEHVSKEVRQQMADEIMYQLAKLLPPAYRGEYSDIENATETYLRFVN